MGAGRDQAGARADPAHAQRRPRFGWVVWTLIGVLMVFGVLPLLLFVGLLGADSFGRWRFNAHADEWRQAIAHEIPPGTSKAGVLAFFAARGVPMSCSSGARDQSWCSARERRDFGVIPVWSLYFEATFEQDDLVSVRQQARGVGF